MTNLPIACTLDPAALKARREGLLTQLLRRADVRHEIDHGYRLQFPAAGDVIDAIARTVEAERHCCRTRVRPPPPLVAQSRGHAWDSRRS